MTMTDQPDLPPVPPAPKKKRKHRPARKRAAPAKPREPDEFAGLTIKQCPTACRAERCVISGHGICSHPAKGGLQGPDMRDPEKFARLDRAKKALGHKKVDAA